ncbi:MAG: serine/threonine protein kinase [Sandaracinus sp.]|nr:serine/threonine protein kinase [Sandaracinus sp.]MCB9624237.1 serine/threonine protein kinase [Sandaracinus sp.]MCB9634005.1 serine/threonine protein kinase [Sandaracinus sp.]
MANAATPRAVEAVPEDARDPLIGRVLEGRYRIDDLLGEGGIGRVYRATHLKLDRPVALKVLHEGFRNSADVRQRFEREAKTLSALRHPNVVTITDYGVEDDLPFLVMELVEGRDLDQLLESQEEPLPIGRVIGLMSQVLRSLAQAHGMGIIHRDLKPGNALLQVLPDGSDHVEVLDFGLAKFVDDAPAAVSSPKLTRAGTVVGTPAYMAPEQASGGACDARTDVYAAGVMLFELLTGELPFPMQDPAAMLRAHLVQTPPKLRSLRPEVAPSLEALIDRALAKDPAQRFADGADMLAALEAIDPRPSGERLLDASDALRETFHSLSAQVPGKIRDVAKGLDLDARIERLRSKLPTPLRSLPPRVLLVGAGALLVLALVTIVALASGGDDAPTEAATPVVPALPEGVPLAEVEPAEDLPDARDPWATNDVPADLVPVKAMLDRGRRLRRAYIGTIRSVGAQHPADCRPPLLLGRAYVAQRWLSGAMPEYLEGFAKDPSCRGDPAMLPDFLEMAASEALHDEAARQIVRIWGEEALDATRAAAEGARRPVERERLQAVVAALEAL